MSPCCCSRDTGAQAGWGLSKAVPSLGCPAHGMSWSCSHWARPPRQPHTHQCNPSPPAGHTGSTAVPTHRTEHPGQGSRPSGWGDMSPLGAIPMLGVKQRRGAGVGWGIIPVPCGSIPNPSSAWSRCCVTSGWPWSPQGTPGWHCHLQSPWAGSAEGHGWTQTLHPRMRS